MTDAKLIDNLIRQLVNRDADLARKDEEIAHWKAEHATAMAFYEDMVSQEVSMRKERDEALTEGAEEAFRQNSR